jgi:hypothetical protein
MFGLCCIGAGVRGCSEPLGASPKRGGGTCSKVGRFCKTPGSVAVTNFSFGSQLVCALLLSNLRVFKSDEGEP